MSLSEEATQISNLLEALTQPNTDAIRLAEQNLKPILKDPRSVPALVEILEAKGVQPDAIRHVASILLRKRITTHYDSYDAATKLNLQSKLLTMLSSEPLRSIRKSLASVAAAIFTIEAVNAPGWMALLQFIGAASSDANAEARELAFILLGEMTEVLGDGYKSEFPSLVQIWQKSLSDVTPSVQMESTRSLGNLMSYLADENEVEHFASLLPSILAVASECQKRGDTDTVGVTLDVLYDLAYSPSPAITAHLPMQVGFCMNLLVDKTLEMKIRDSAALVIATLAESKPKTFGKEEELLGQVIEALFQLIENSPDSAAGALFEGNPAWKEDYKNDDDDFDEDDDQPSETSMAQGTLDMLACEIPKKYIFQPVTTRAIARLGSTHANQRKAGIACLGVVAEGCSEPLREHLSEVMPHVLHSASDPDAQVRECACFALGQLSEHCQPEILTFSSQILPVVFQLLDDQAVTVQATSCYVLEMFCERLEPDAVRPLLDPLVQKLGSMLETSTKRSVQEMAVAAMAATAVAAEEEFTPYVPNVATLMGKFMALTDEKFHSLRGRALECMGHMAIAVGRDTFRPYFSDTMKCACEGLTFPESTDLHEFAYAVFANLAKVMQDEFSPVLAELVPHLVKVVEMDEGDLKAEQVEEEKQFSALDSDDEEDDNGNYVFSVRTALLESKKGAITALGEIAAHTAGAFVPYLEQTLTVLQQSAQNWHPLVKTVTAEALPSMVIPAVTADHGGEIGWTKGQVDGASPLSATTTQVVTMVLGELLTLMKDDDKETVGKACEGIQSVIELCGPYALGPILTDCLANTYALLTRSSSCFGHTEGEELTEDDDHETFMTSVCDLVGGFARVLGDGFTQFLPQFLPAVLAYAKTSRPPSDRSMAMGCMGEIAQELGLSIAPHWEGTFLPAIMGGLADEDDNVKRNCAFCAGVCSEGLGETIAANYPALLQALSPLFSVDVSKGDASAACVDNAAAGIARMIMASPTHVPLDQVLPVWLAAMPLKNDMTENETVYKCLIGLLSMDKIDPSLKGEVKRILTEALADGSRVEDETKAQLRETLTALG